MESTDKGPGEGEFPVVERRHALGMTGYRLAQLAMTTPSHIWRVERRQCVPNVELAMRIAAALESDVPSLFGPGASVPADLRRSA